ncbi:MAG TPA: hypothetical protein VF921_06210 [Vicinamibacterales bacterium]
MISVRRLTLVIAAVAAIAHAAPATGQQAASPDPAARPDAVCVAIVLPAIEGAEGDSATLAESVRTVFASYLTGPSLKALPLVARLPSQAAEEARQKDCPRVLTVALVLTHHGGHALAGAISRAAGTAAWYVPASGVGSAIAVGTAVAGAEAVSAVASSTRAKDEMRIDYRVTSPEGAAILAPKSDKAKAKADREDLVTPLVAKAAAAVAAAVARK